MKLERLVPLVLAALLAPAPAVAHGVVVEIERRDGAVAARARYEGGRPLAGARYEVVSPASPERAFDEGRTDRHGWVAFVPDAPGTWRVRIVDDSGHGRVAMIEVTSTATATSTATPTSTSTPSATPSATPTSAFAPSRAVRSLLGATALALAFGALHAVQRRRRGGR
jgi:nickel transport protein